MRQIRVATDPLTRQLEKLYDLMKELQKDTARRNEGTSAQIPGPPRTRGEKYEMVTGAPLTTLFELLNGPMNPLMRQPDNIKSTRQQPNKQRWPLLPEGEEEEPEQFNNSPTDHVVTAINNLPHIL